MFIYKCTAGRRAGGVKKMEDWAGREEEKKEKEKQKAKQLSV